MQNTETIVGVRGRYQHVDSSAGVTACQDFMIDSSLTTPHPNTLTSPYYSSRPYSSAHSVVARTGLHARSLDESIFLASDWFNLTIQERCRRRLSHYSVIHKRERKKMKTSKKYLFDIGNNRLLTIAKKYDQLCIEEKGSGKSAGRRFYSA